MSIATLKKKSSAKYSKNMSIPNDGFALNGKLRVKGWVGPTNLGRTVNGTCCTVQSTVKVSTRNTKAGIKHKHAWLKGGGYPYKPGALGFWTQAGMTGTENIQGTQSEYISKLASNNVGAGQTFGNPCSQLNETIPGKPDAGINNNRNAKGYHIGGKITTNNVYGKQLQVDRTTTERLYKLKYQCINPNKQQTPFPFKINHTSGAEGCSINFQTYQDSQNAGWYNSA